MRRCICFTNYDGVDYRIPLEEVTHVVKNSHFLAIKTTKRLFHLYDLGQIKYIIRRWKKFLSKDR